MAEFQWWLLIVGLIAGGALVAALSMDSARRDADVAADERAAEATFVADQLVGTGRELDRETVEAILLAHHAYLKLPPPDRIEAIGPAAPSATVPAAAPAAAPIAPAPPAPTSARDRDADRQPDEVGDGRGGPADEDLPPT